jgi:hypothetical protein
VTTTASPPITDEALVEELVEIHWQFARAYTGIELQPFQEDFGRAMLRSIVGNRGDELTGLISRQSGKTELMADMIVAIMVLLPRLARIERYAHLLEKFKRGVWVGLFAPTEAQIQTMFDRIKDRFSSDQAEAIRAEDDDLNDPPDIKGSVITLKKCHSLVRMSTCNLRAKIESKTYHVIIIDEAQGADETMITKSIGPMGARTNATRIMIGTPDIQIGYFYKAIKRNKRLFTEHGGVQRHFEYNWKTVAKYNPDYGKYIEGEKEKFGEDSDEFRMAYMVQWILERGMFITTTRLDDLGDRTMPRVKQFNGPCYAGIDPARKIDSTVVTIVWPDFNNPNENGLYPHRVLDWLEMPGEGWEEQYFRIQEFLSRYNVQAVAVDEGGVGDTVVDRMRHILPSYVDVVSKSSSPKAQSERWKYLIRLLTETHQDTGPLLRYPAHPEARRTKTWKRFYQQMSELEKKYQGAYLLAEAPTENGAHDDFCDSLALACSVTESTELPTVEVSDNFFLR